MPIVTLPNGQEIDFPQGMSASDISAALQPHTTVGQFIGSILDPKSLKPYREVAKPYIEAAIELSKDIAPGISQVRSAGRIGNLREANRGNVSPIRRLLNQAEIGFEGASMAADFVPGLKAGAMVIGAVANKGLFKNNTLRFLKDKGKENLINADGSITVFHGTSKANAKKIQDSGKFKGHPFFALDEETARRFAGQAGRSPEVIKINVDPDIAIPISGSDLSARIEGLVKGRDGVFRVADTPIVRKGSGVERLPMDEALKSRGVQGDNLLNAQDMAEDLLGVGAQIDNKGMVTVFHRTSKENAEEIARTGKMSALEPDIFFSTSKDSEFGLGFGENFIEAKIPIENLRLDDIFPGKDASVSVHVKGPIGTPMKFNIIKRNNE